MNFLVSSSMMENSQQSSLSLTSLGSQAPLQKITYAFFTFSFCDPKFCGTLSVFLLCLPPRYFFQIHLLVILSFNLSNSLFVNSIDDCSYFNCNNYSFIFRSSILFLSESSWPCLITSMLACQNDSILSEWQTQSYPRQKPRKVLASLKALWKLILAQNLR